eukprot:TRINITY_DN40938_c0_g1_i1.p1 TRINITY_DN40938_c0_g1~~TRINITY_DN40938_c0_g1_i1.p1  ORF type:complete len:106 (+),score=16.28 TRINITY_DN40938_c0_g1_i1:170-487(+)
MAPFLITKICKYFDVPYMNCQEVLKPLGPINRTTLSCMHMFDELSSSSEPKLKASHTPEILHFQHVVDSGTRHIKEALVASGTLVADTSPSGRQELPAQTSFLLK